MNQLILIIIIIIIFLYLVKPIKINYQPIQEEIQDPKYINKTQLNEEYPYPQISRPFKQLGNGKLPTPMNNLSDILPNGTKELKITKNIQTPDTMVKNMADKLVIRSKVVSSVCAMTLGTTTRAMTTLKDAKSIFCLETRSGKNNM